LKILTHHYDYVKLIYRNESTLLAVSELPSEWENIRKKQ
jgi:hypothetical protein